MQLCSGLCCVGSPATEGHGGCRAPPHFAPGWPGTSCLCHPVPEHVVVSKPVSLLVFVFHRPWSTMRAWPTGSRKTCSASPTMSAATSALAYSASKSPPFLLVYQWSVLPVQGRPRVDLPKEAVSGEALLSYLRKPNVWTPSWTARFMTALTARVAGALVSSPVRPMRLMELSFLRAGGGGET